MRTQAPSVLDPDYLLPKRAGDYCTVKAVPGLPTRHREKLRLSAILSGFSEVIATDPFLLWKNREDIEYGTQELRNEW